MEQPNRSLPYLVPLEKCQNIVTCTSRLTKALTDDIIFLCETRLKKTYFTRIGNNKMTFKSIINFILNF